MDSAALLDILGNENRRRILRLLSHKPCYVTEISDFLGVGPKAVIDHLRKLEEAGLVESRTDDQRRKYFHISRNLRLEVSVSPYEFGMKSAYPASPSLDVTSCRYLSLDLKYRDDDARESSRSVGDGTANGLEPGEVVDLAERLNRLEQLQSELSLAQRWVHGRVTDVLDELSDAVETDGESRMCAEVLATIAGGSRTTVEISDAVEAPRPVVEDCLAGLADRGLVVREGDAWRIAD